MLSISSSGDTMKPHELTRYFELQDEAANRAQAILSAIDSRAYVDDFSLLCDDVRIEYHIRHCSCCSPDYDCVRVPVELFYCDTVDVVEKVNNWKQLREAEAKAAKAIEDARAAAEEVERLDRKERAEFERLKAKFNPTSFDE